MSCTKFLSTVLVLSAFAAASPAAPSLAKRTQVQYCSAQIGNAGCHALSADDSINLAKVIGQAQYDRSSAKSCDGTAGTDNDVVWKYYGSGPDCSTTSELETLQGAFHVYLESQGNQICNVMCIQEGHGSGTWTGYTVVGPSWVSLEGLTCNDSLQFGNCGSGGKKDI